MSSFYIQKRKQKNNERIPRKTRLYFAKIVLLDVILIIMNHREPFQIRYKKEGAELINLPLLGEQYRKDEFVDEKEDYNPFDIENIQTYNPLYNKFFVMNESNYRNTSLQSKYQMVDLHQVKDVDGVIAKRDVFVKFAPLLDPYRYMIGKYDVKDDKYKTLPQLHSNKESVDKKLLSVHNASYVDSFFCYLTGMLYHHHNIVHGIDYYGSFLGMQKKHRIDICDDLEYLRNSTFFHDQIGKLFYIEDENATFQRDASSRKNKEKIVVSDETLCIACEELPDLPTTLEASSINDELEEVFQKSRTNSMTSESSSSSEETESDISYNESEEEHEDEDDDGSDEDIDTEDEESEESEEEEQVYAYIHHFPVQLICMEKCEGTVDELFSNEEMDEPTASSMLFQVVMMLLMYQKMFQFTHNDLHTNNIMFVTTEKEYLYYQYEGKCYKVPTYGKIYKIIDFGRSIYKFHGNTFCSDSFAKDGDASTQYNCEPFMNKKRPRLEPNNSFDLCRLASSIFDFIMDIDDKEESLDELQKTVLRWCKDDNGKNVLYKRNGEERYPSFKLYKMIARTVHHHSPQSQLEHSFFNQFHIKECDAGDCMNIDTLPHYYEKLEKTI